jgi:hypothetical protein
MDVVSLGPFRVGSIVWQRKPGAWVLTAVCKVTFELRPDESPLADEQDSINEEDNHWNDDRSRSLYAPSDLVPFKPRPEVLLVGSAFAPRKEPVHALTARLFVGDVDKSIEVFGDRSMSRDGQVRTGAPFTKMALRYEKAAGGASNPVGVRLDATSTMHGSVQLPNLQPPDTADLRSGIAPIGFGPIAASWPERLAKLGPLAGAWPTDRWNERPIPEGLNPTFFNAAPADQELEALLDRQLIILENLHPEHPRLVTSLPGLRPKALIERPGAAPEALEITADTLWIDTDRALCTVVWRGQVLLKHRAEAGQVVWRGQVPLKHRAEAGRAVAAPPPSNAEALATMPLPAMFSEGSPKDGGHGGGSETLHLSKGSSRLPTLPFVEASGVESPLARFDPSLLQRRADTGTVTLSGSEDEEEEERGDTAILSLGSEADAEPISVRDLEDQNGDASLDSWETTSKVDPAHLPPRPFVAQPAPIPSRPAELAPAPPPRPAEFAPAPPPRPAELAPPSQARPVEIAPPAPVRPVVSSDPIAPPVTKSPWAASAGSPGSFGAQGRAPAPAPAPAVVAPSLATPAAPMPNAAAHGVRAASDAAAASVIREAPSPAPAPAPRARPREIVKLLWHDAKALPRVRKHPRWRVLLAELELRLLERGDLDDQEEGEAADADRRDVFEVLARGEPIGADGIGRALDGAIDEDGKLEPPLVLVAGELDLPFDELETLKATATAVSPFAAADKRLKDTLDVVTELLRTPYMAGAGGLAETMTGRLKEAFAQGKRPLPPEALDGHIDRMLLEQRAYQKRAVYGKRWIRALLAAGTTAQVPVYIPEALAGELPMFRRIRVRMIAEVDLKEDQSESSAHALKVMVLGRVVSP